MRIDATDDLARDFSGELVAPGDPAYDEARALYNTMFDHRPALIARCRGVGDVVAAVRFARRHHLPLCVRGSGHGVDGRALADGAFAIDLQSMDAVLVDPRSRRAIVQSGARWRAVDRETQLHGLAVTAGTVSDTGVSGLTLGGGIGYAVRKLGPTVDSLVGIDCVTVEGEVVHASEAENPDLFWAMRGGGGNFAIATAFHFALHPLGPQVQGGILCFPGERAREVLQAWRGVMDDAPDELMSIAMLLYAPPAPLFPEELHGKLVVTMYVAHLGEVEEGARAIAPLRDLGPLFDGVSVMPYVELQRAQESSTVADGMRWYEKARYARVLEDGLIEAFIRVVGEAPHAKKGELSRSLTAIWRMGGAFTRREEDSMAFVREDAEYMFIISSAWYDPAEDEEWMAWVKQSFPQLEPYASPHIYFNLATWEANESELESAYGGAKFAKLAEIKRRWDPENVLRHTKNIKPAA